GKDTCEQAAWRQMRRSNPAVVADIAAQLEPARHLLRVVAFDAGTQREVRRAAEHEVEPLVRADRRGRAEVAVPDLVTGREPVVGRRLTRQPNALVLRLDGHEARARQPP